MAKEHGATEEAAMRRKDASDDLLLRSTTEDRNFKVQHGVLKESSSAV